jgi:hypothetical protein
MSDYESRREDAKQEAWEEKYSRPCVQCARGGHYDGFLILTEKYEVSRTEPGCELWECPCGHEEEG